MEVDITKKAKKVIGFGLIGLILLAVLAGGGIYLYQHYNQNLTVYDAQTASSMVAAKTKADGTLTEMVVADGDPVKAGDVIARIAPKVTDEQVKQLEQNLALARQNYEQLKKGGIVIAPSAATVPTAPQVDAGAQQRAAQALSRLQRMNELFSMGAISAVKRDEAAADYAAAQAAANSASTPAAAPPAATVPAPVDPEIIKQADLQVKQAEAALNNAKEDQQATDILAPVAGIVYYTDVTEGSDVKAGQTIVNIGDADNIWLEAKLNPEQAKKVRLGQFATYDLEGHELQGTIQDIKKPEDTTSNDADGDDSADTQQATPADTWTIVRISLPSGLSFNVVPGLKATVKFAIDR